MRAELIMAGERRQVTLARKVAISTTEYSIVGLRKRVSRRSPPR
jgi:hypothetical protein